MDTTTTYKTELAFTVKDETTAAIAGLTAKIEGMARASEHMTHKLNEIKSHGLATIGAFVGMGLGVHSLWEHLISANEELEEHQKKIAGSLIGLKKWGEAVPMIDRVTESLADAKKVTAEMEETEERLAMPMQTLVGIYNSLAGPMFKKLGKDQEAVLKMTDKTAAAAKLFGVSGEEASGVIGRALMTKSIRPFGVFGKALSAAVGDMHKLTTAQAYDRMSKVINEWAKGGEKMAGGFKDAKFRLKDVIEDTLRDVGTPVFIKLTAEIGKWAKYIKNASIDGKPLVQVFSDKLLTAFNLLAKATEIIVKNWKSIVLLIGASRIAPTLQGAAGALTAAAGRMGSAGGTAAVTGGGGPFGFGGALYGAAQAASGVHGPLPLGHFGDQSTVQTLGKTTGAMKGLLGGVGKAAAFLTGPWGIAIAGGAVAVDLLSDSIGDFVKAMKEHEKEMEKAEGEVGNVAAAFKMLSNVAHKGTAADIENTVGKVGKLFKKIGAVDEEGAFSKEAMEKYVGNLSNASRSTIVEQMSEFGGANREIRDFVKEARAGQKMVETGSLAAYKIDPARMSEMAAIVMGLAAQAVASGKTGKTGKPEKPVAEFKGDVHIHQDFKDQDPDRVFVRFKNDMEGYAEKALAGSSSRKWAGM